MSGLSMPRARMLIAALAVCCGSLFGASLAMAEDAQLSKLWSALSEDDRAVLEVASAKANSWVTTTKGSANDQMWTELASRGYLAKEELSERYGENAAPAMEAAGFKAYSVTWKGAKELPDILKEFKKP